MSGANGRETFKAIFGGIWTKRALLGWNVWDEQLLGACDASGKALKVKRVAIAQCRQNAFAVSDASMCNRVQTKGHASAQLTGAGSTQGMGQPRKLDCLYDRRWMIHCLCGIGSANWHCSRWDWHLHSIIDTTHCKSAYLSYSLILFAVLAIETASLDLHHSLHAAAACSSRLRSQSWHSWRCDNKSKRKWECDKNQEVLRKSLKFFERILRISNAHSTNTRTFGCNILHCPSQRLMDPKAKKSGSKENKKELQNMKKRIERA